MEIIGHMVAGALVAGALLGLLHYVSSGKLLRSLARECPRATATLRTAGHWLRLQRTRRRVARDFDATVAHAHRIDRDIRWWAQRRHEGGPIERELARSYILTLSAQRPPCPCPAHREHTPHGEQHA